MTSFLEGLFGLSGQVAVVVGGTGVLCSSLAKGLAQAGATVVIAGRDRERGEAVVAAIVEAGGQASFASVSVDSRESIEALLATTLERNHRCDILINGAGINHASAYLDLQDDDWDRVLRANLDGVHYACQVFGKFMTEQGKGAILNITSVTAHLPLSRVFAYSASKAAVENLSKNLAREFAPFGVRVNALSPGFFPAEQNRKILDQERVASIMRQTPMQRFGEPQELVGACLLLLSPSAGSFITGSNIYVDGGFTAMRF